MRDPGKVRKFRAMRLWVYRPFMSSPETINVDDNSGLRRGVGMVSTLAPSITNPARHSSAEAQNAWVGAGGVDMILFVGESINQNV